MLTSHNRTRNRIFRRLTLLLCLLAPLLVASPAQAAGRDSKERAARKACLSGNAEKRVALLSDLFLDTGDPNYIYNQGRCYEQGHRREDAIASFREYLLKASNMSPE